MGLRGYLPESGVEVIGARSERPVPEPPEDLHPQLLDEWRTYWQSPVAQAADDVDIPMISRLFIYRDEWYRLSIAYAALPDEDRLIEGSTRSGAGLRIHPFAERMTKLEGDIQKLEDKLGLSPLSRARLGIEIGQQKLTWQQLQRAAGGGHEEVGTDDRVFNALPVAGARDA